MHLAYMYSLHAFGNYQKRMRFTVNHYRKVGRKAAQYDRAVGKPSCRYGKECRRANLQHWSDYDHPPNHPRLSAGADFGLPPVPLPRYPMPVCIDISAFDDEDEGHVSARPEGTGLVDRGHAGLIHFRIACSGPQELQAQRRQIADGVDPQLLMASTGVHQDGAAAAAAAAVTVAARPPPEAPGIATPFDEAVATNFEVMIKLGQSLGYNKPAEPLVLRRNYDALMRLRRLQGVSRDSNVVVVVCGEGMNAAGNHILDPKCPSGKAVQAAMQRALLGSEYGVSGTSSPLTFAWGFIPAQVRSRQMKTSSTAFFSIQCSSICWSSTISRWLWSASD